MEMKLFQKNLNYQKIESKSLMLVLILESLKKMCLVAGLKLYTQNKKNITKLYITYCVLLH